MHPSLRPSSTDGGRGSTRWAHFGCPSPSPGASSPSAWAGAAPHLLLVTLGRLLQGFQLRAEATSVPQSVLVQVLGLLPGAPLQSDSPVGTDLVITSTL